MSPRSWGILAAVLVAYTLVGVYAWRSKQAQMARGFLAAGQLRVDALQAEVERLIEQEKQNIRFLSRLADVRDSDDASPMLRKVLRSYAETRSHVFQVRLLDTSGKERVRIVEHEPGQFRVASADELQDKSTRYYFQEAAELPEGQVFVSPLDLNVERGVVEKPLRPTIRFVSPIFRSDGERRGVLVINVDAQFIRATVQRAQQNTEGQLLLVSDDGTYLVHPDGSQEFGAESMLGHGRGLGLDHPRWLTKDGQVDWGKIAARTPSQSPHVALAESGSPRVVLIADAGDVLQRNPWEMAPLIAALAVTLGVIAVVVLARLRLVRVRTQLARERELLEEISEREKSLREAQKRLVARAHLTALSESAATLAHELRNPLASIVNAAGLLRGSASDDDGETGELLAIVEKECKRLNRVVTDYLALARRPKPQIQSTDLGTIVSDVVELMQHSEEHKNLRVPVGVDVDSRARPVLADPDEIAQVVWNVVLNATSATRRAGGQEVRLRILPGGADEADSTVLEVLDGGEGPPAPGTSGSSASPENGSGLGLIVAAGIIARSGGSLDMHARPEGGTRTIVTLPTGETKEKNGGSPDSR